jgi:hypothetical protein
MKETSTVQAFKGEMFKEHKLTIGLDHCRRTRKCSYDHPTASTATGPLTMVACTTTRNRSARHCGTSPVTYR